MSSDLILPLVGVAFSLAAAVGVKFAAIRHDREGKDSAARPKKMNVKPRLPQHTDRVGLHNRIGKVSLTQQGTLHRADFRYGSANSNVMNRDPVRRPH